MILTHETERRYLLSKSADDIIRRARRDQKLTDERLIEQRYLADTGDWSIRIRLSTALDGSDPKYCVTMKRKVTKMTSIEIEYPISARTFAEMAACAGHAIRKRRSYIRHGDHMLELDVFLNPELEGLELVEIELADESVIVHMPRWAGVEVTGKRQYKNARLSRKLRG